MLAHKISSKLVKFVKITRRAQRDLSSTVAKMNVSVQSLRDQTAARGSRSATIRLFCSLRLTLVNARQATSKILLQRLVKSISSVQPHGFWIKPKTNACVHQPTTTINRHLFANNIKRAPQAKLWTETPTNASRTAQSRLCATKINTLTLVQTLVMLVAIIVSSARTTLERASSVLQVS